MQQKKKAAIFDLDGTLVDSMGVWADIDALFFQKRGLVMPDDYVEAVKTMDYAEAARYTIERFCLPDSSAAVQEEWHTMAVEQYEKHVPLKPFVREYLNQLASQGVAIGLATVSNASLYQPVLAHHEVAHFFQACVSIDQVIGDKSKPDIFLAVAAKLGVSPEHCVVYEDALRGVMGALAAGMQVVGVYDKSSAKDETRLRQLCQRYIYHFGELLEPPQ